MRDSKPIAKEAEHAKDAFGACRAEALAKAGSTCPFSSFGVHASACPNINSHPERFRRKAQRIVSEEMRRLGWREADLERHRKGDRRKVKIARRSRQETTMTLKWMADRLKMGTWTHVANRLYHLKK